jgi:hypothetical protein
MQRLLEIYERFGVRGTFMAEVMQQLKFRERQSDYPELGTLADKWDEAITGAFRRGHDVQLHIHPQWSSAEYSDGQWRLSGDWSLPKYQPAEAEKMIAAGKAYLERLLTPIDPKYKCVAFRSGSSVIAPSQFMLKLLADIGIVFDISIVGGLRVNTRNLVFDYTACEEDLLPFYPEMSDARRVSNKKEPIVCVPIFSFRGSRRSVVRQLAGKAVNRLRPGEKSAASYSKDQWAEIGRTSPVARIYDKAIHPTLFGKHLTADIGRLDYNLLCEMMASIRAKARSTGLAKIPVVLTNHSKDMTDFEGFERFLSELAGQKDIRFLTLADLADRLTAGEFVIRTKPV